MVFDLRNEHNSKIVDFDGTNITFVLSRSFHEKELRLNLERFQENSSVASYVFDIKMYMKLPHLSSNRKEHPYSYLIETFNGGLIAEQEDGSNKKLTINDGLLHVKQTAKVVGVKFLRDIDSIHNNKIINLSLIFLSFIKNIPTRSVLLKFF